MDNLAIIGCGQASLALTYYFYTQNVIVTLYKNVKHPGAINQLEQRKSIQIKGIYNDFLPLPKISSDLKNILQENKLIYIVLPTYAHEETFKSMLPYLTSEHIIINVTGNFSSLFYGKKLIGKNSKPIIADINLSPFACRLDQNYDLNIIGLKKMLYISALNPGQTKPLIHKIQKIFPSALIESSNVIEVGLSNVNGICHPALLIFNAGRIGENKEKFYFNKDGITHEIENILLAIEEDRLKIAKNLNINVLPFLITMNNFYKEEFNSFYEFFKKTTILNSEMLCPSKLDGRYLEEDIAYVLVPWLSLAKITGYKTVALESLIKVASLLINKDYLNKGRNLELVIDLNSRKHF